MTQSKSVDKQLIEIRCPNMTTKRKQGTDREEVCNKSIVKVAPGSKGEAYCVSCKFSFEFDVAKGNDSIGTLLGSI